MSLRLLIPILGATALLSCGDTAVAAQCDLIAAPSGRDAAAGTEAAPMRTPQAVIERLRPGQTGCLRAGTYGGRGRQGFVAYFDHGGRPGAPLRLRGYPGERPVLHGVLVVTRRAPHVEVSDLDVDDPYPYNSSGQLSVQLNARHTVLRRLDITNHATKTCVILGSGGAGVARRTAIRDSVLHDCGVPGNLHDQAIYVQDARRTAITGNIIRGTGSYAVQLYPNAQRSLVRRNVIAGNGGGIIVAGEGDKASSHSLIERNVVTDSLRLPNLQVYWGGRVGQANLVRDNCFWNGATPDRLPGLVRKDNLVADPLLAPETSLPSADSRCSETVGAALAKVASSLRS